jgi:hypothetical protein
MDWTTPFIIYRIGQDGKLEEVFHAADLKMAKYWLSYIAQPGDVLCRTPKHPKHSQTSRAAEYWSHKEQSGVSATDRTAWEQYATRLQWTEGFPTEQTKENIS